MTWQALDNLILISVDSPLKLSDINRRLSQIRYRGPFQHRLFSRFCDYVSCVRKKCITSDNFCSTFEFLSEHAISMVIPVIISFLQGQNSSSHLWNNKLFYILYDLFAFQHPKPGLISVHFFVSQYNQGKAQ